MIVYLKGARKLFGATPYNSQCFTKESFTSPNTVTKGEYLGSPRQVTMGCISLVSLKEKNVRHKVDVTEVDMAEIFSTNPDNHDRELFLIQGEVRRGEKMLQPKEMPHFMFLCGEPHEITTTVKKTGSMSTLFCWNQV
jgi:hypothetical protein